ncbi:histidinol dehydrogenase [Escherichia coli]|nr:histidinol dehydrogenase [Escherichia coli]
MSFNTIIDWNSCTAEQQRQLLMRPAISASESITRTVNDILDSVKARGDDALREYSAKFDKTTVTALKVSAEEITAASERLSDELKQAMAVAVAVKNIETFHTAQKMPPVDVETQPGVRCQQVTRPVASVGLYIPGGSAPLFSTVLMLATPARIAGCKKVVLCSPPPIADEILYAAQLCGVQDVFNVGGAQAIAALAFGTESVPKVDKIFGPGNAFVTEAKRQVSQRLNGAAIDMPAGPSEVLVIADSGATPDFVASDLLSQAEHGPDSQVILLTPAADMARRVAEAVERQLAELPRAETARQALSASRLIVTKDLAQCVEISNQYGPEHLIIQTRNARELVDGITSAGSVFLGDWSPESAGDYASGTNHVLPTYGYTATCSSLGLADFQKRMTVQELSKVGFSALASTIETLAAAERLTAHKNAVTLRVNALKEQA